VTVEEIKIGAGFNISDWLLGENQLN
jgi:hypothetical protein